MTSPTKIRRWEASTATNFVASFGGRWPKSDRNGL